VSAVGCRALAVADAVQGVTLPVHVLYPATGVAAPVSFGPYAIDVAADAPVAGEALPLVAISHGNSGSPWVHRDLALAIARAGFAVVLVEHLGNSRSDNRLVGTPANLANRPRHVGLALDAALAALGAHAAPRAAVIGHSIGGYTALAVAGGAPVALPRETPDGVARPVLVEPDPRVRAVVLLAPALPWLMSPGALAAVTVPVMVRTGERDDATPPFVVERILAGLPAPPVDARVVPGAGHFAFQSPFPPAMVSPGFPPSQDPPGFDRAAYQPALAAEVVAFLRTRL
jgi:predicted dienelactone hydrolase